MKTRTLAAILVACLLTAYGTPWSAGAEPAPCRISDFTDVSSLLEEMLPAGSATARFVPVLQQDGWGWEDDTTQGKSTPDKPAPPKDEDKPADGSKAGWGAGADESVPPGEAPRGGELEETGPRNWSRKTRIGIEFGAFIPMGAMQESFSSGQFAGLFFGFGLPSVAGDFTPTMEIRITEGTTRSIDQVTGFDVSTTLLGIRDDLLFHLMPGSKSFNVFFFLGAGLMLEMSSGKAIDPATGDSVSVSKTFPLFVVDTGIGAWLNIAGPLDLFLRLEFDIIPTSKNVSLFSLGQIGIQARF